MQKIIVNTGILVLAFAVFLNTARAQQNPATVSSTHTRSTHSTYLNVEEDTTVTPHQTIVTYKDDRLYHFVVIDDKIAELYVNSRKIPLDSLYVYEPVFKKISEQVKKDKRQAEEDRKQADEDQKQAIRDEAQAREDEKQAMEDKVQAERDAEQSVKDSKEADEDRAEASADRKQVDEDRKQAEEDRKQADRDREQADEDRKQAEEDRKQAIKDKEQAERDEQQAHFDAKRAAEDQAVMKSMITELVKQGLIADKKSLYSLSLDENELVLNGKKQTEALHKQFASKFLIRPGYSISYRHEH